SQDRVSIAFEDQAGMIWVATRDGLNRFDPQTEQFIVYRHDAQDPRSLSQRPTAIREDSQGRLWIGTVNGLNQFDRGQGTFTRFTNQGLPETPIRGILEDREGYLWLASDDGLTRFDPRTKGHRTYSESDGLPGNLLNPYEAEGCWRSPDGQLM